MNTTPTETGALDIVIFGGAGDLSFRKLLPALYMAHLHSRLSPGTRIVAVGRQNWSREEYLDFIDKHSPQFIEKNALTPDDWKRFMDRFRIANQNCRPSMY